MTVSNSSSSSSDSQSGSNSNSSSNSNAKPILEDSVLKEATKHDAGSNEKFSVCLPAEFTNQELLENFSRCSMSEDDEPVEVKLSLQKRQIYLNNLFRGGNAPFQQRELNLFGTFCSSHPNLTFSVRSNHQNFNLMLRKPVITETDSEENKMIRKEITNDFFSQFTPPAPVAPVKPSIGGLLNELSSLTPDFDF